MRHSRARSVLGLLALLSFKAVALAQESKLPGRDDLFHESNEVDFATRLRVPS